MDPRQFEEQLNHAENSLKRLKSLYEQWFQGIERIEPQHLRKQLERHLRTLKQRQPRNTALRFRLQQCFQRYATYSTYWNRVSRQIEEGTYKRDVIRAKQRRGAAQAAERQEPRDAAPPAHELDPDMDIDAALEALTQPHEPSAGAEVGGGPEPGTSPSAAGPQPSAPPPVPEAARRRTAHPADASVPPPIPPGARTSSRRAQPSARSAGAPASGISEQQMRQIYDKFLAARRQNNQRTDNVQLETVSRHVRNMLPKLQKKHAGKAIDFEVVVRDGKVALKPVPK